MDDIFALLKIQKKCPVVLEICDIAKKHCNRGNKTDLREIWTYRMGSSQAIYEIGNIFNAFRYLASFGRH